MNEEFEEVIIKRCEAALLECEKYMNKERSADADPDELQADAEVLCYKKGFNDAMKIMNNAS